GRPFKLYKFRTLAVEADKELIWGQAEQKSPTRIGRFLRRSGLDELPQIINILKGDMSLVGPRPERVEFVTLFSEKIPHYMQRHMVPPGVTGWAQINGWRGDTPLAPRIEHDLWYIAHWSLALDVGILLKTIPFILKTLLSK
ncbi:UDP-phosphate glucose phosphotransferase, partial [Candidatus Parcubacteria bacterium]